MIIFLKFHFNYRDVHYNLQNDIYIFDYSREVPFHKYLSALLNFTVVTRLYSFHQQFWMETKLVWRFFLF